MYSGCLNILPAIPFLVCCVLTQAQTATAPTHDSRIILRDVMWQALPSRIRDVCVGPDQKVWYESKGSRSPDLALAVQDIKRQFHNTSPLLDYATVALFESGGRVWFTAMERQVILGYDGKDLIEYRPQVGFPGGFVGICQGRRPRGNKPWNLYFDKHAFFPAPRGVHVYDGSVWSYQHMSDHTRPHIAMFALEEERQVVAVADGRRFWRWKDGTWSLSPFTVAEGRATVVWPGNQALVFTYPRISLVLLDDRPDAKFAPLLARMKASTDPETRRRIGREMVALGQPVRALAEQAVSSTYDQIVIEHLLVVLEGLKDFSNRLVLGDYQLESPQVICNEPSGRAYLWAENVLKAGQSVGAGVVIADSAEKARFVATEVICRPWREGERGPLLVPGGESVWLPRQGPNGEARLLDLATGKFTHTLPLPQYQWLYAAQADGTLFVGQTGPESQPELMVYRPGAPDDRRLLKVQRVRMQGAFCVADDGTIWTTMPEQGLVRFDGRNWRSIPGLNEKGGARFLWPFADGSVLAGYDNDLALIAEGRVAFEADAKMFVTRNRERLVGNRFSFCEQRLDPSRGIVVDAADNVWLLDNNRLSVLTGSQWVDARESLIEAGSEDGQANYIAGVSHGSRVYVVDSRSYNSGRSFSGRIDQGRIVLEPAPPVYEESAPMGIRDQEDALWLPGCRAQLNKQAGTIVNYAAQRLAETGVTNEVLQIGFPRLCDKDNNIWIGHMGYPSNTTGAFVIWRNGSIRGRITIPARGPLHLLSDRPGSVYAVTATSIFHLVRNVGEGRASFRVAGEYAPNIPLNQVRGADVSPEFGCIVVPSRGPDFNSETYLNLIECPGGPSLPNDSQAGGKDLHPETEQGDETRSNQ